MRHVDPADLHLMMTIMPNNTTGSVSSVTYECILCGEMRIIELPTDIAKKEQMACEKEKQDLIPTNYL
jgi:hypothetical protein